MMIATCLGSLPGEGGSGTAVLKIGLVKRRFPLSRSLSRPLSPPALDGHDFLFFRGQSRVDFVHVLVGHFLQLIGRLAVLILSYHMLLFHPLQMIHPVAPRVAHRYACGFGILMGEFGQFTAAFLIQLRNRYPDKLSVQLRIETKARIANRLVHRLR
jgi:hypothetical protein